MLDGHVLVGKCFIVLHRHVHPFEGKKLIAITSLLRSDDVSAVFEGHHVSSEPSADSRVWELIDVLAGLIGDAVDLVVKRSLVRVRETPDTSDPHYFVGVLGGGDCELVSGFP